MEKNIIDEARDIINKSKSLKDKYFRISKKELYNPEEVDIMSEKDYKRFYDTGGVKKFVTADENFKKAKELQEKIQYLEEMVVSLNLMYGKRSIWEKCTTYRTVLCTMRQILKGHVQEMEEELEEKAEQVKDGDIDI